MEMVVIHSFPLLFADDLTHNESIAYSTGHSIIASVAQLVIASVAHIVSRTYSRTHSQSTAEKDHLVPYF